MSRALKVSSAIAAIAERRGAGTPRLGLLLVLRVVPAAGAATEEAGGTCPPVAGAAADELAPERERVLVAAAGREPVGAAEVRTAGAAGTGTGAGAGTAMGTGIGMSPTMSGGKASPAKLSGSLELPCT